MCECENQTFVDGGDVYVRVGGKELSKIQVLKNCITCKHAEFVDYVSGPKCYVYKCNCPIPECISKNGKHYIYMYEDTNELISRAKPVEDCPTWKLKDK
jgi:hypothetical protein